MKEFETLVGVTKEVIKAVTGGDPEIRVQRIDEGGLDGDLCAIVRTADKAVVAVVWPTAEKLPVLKKLAEVRLGMDCGGGRGGGCLWGEGAGQGRACG
jgi:hypothetical protein